MFEEILKKTLEDYDISINKKQLQKFCIYTKFMLETNNKFNLTSITTFEDIAMKHFLDSLLITKIFDFSKIKNCIDIGSGAGFPGIVLSIFFDDKLKFVLNESSVKKSDFLKEISKIIDINNIEILNMRAEDASKLSAYRQKFDLCIARAVADLNILLELCIPFVKLNGFFISYKSLSYKRELEVIKNNKKDIILGAKFLDKKQFDIKIDEFESMTRSFLSFKKIKNTSMNFPRKYSIIKNVKN